MTVGRDKSADGRGFANVAPPPKERCCGSSSLAGAQAVVLAASVAIGFRPQTANGVAATPIRILVMG
jgi:hypothetical protein